MRAAAPDDPASRALYLVRGARYPRRSFQWRSPGWRETKASEFFSQILQEPGGSSGRCSKHPAMKTEHKDGQKARTETAGLIRTSPKLPPHVSRKILAHIPRT